LTEVECLRTVDRLRLAGELSEEQTAERRQWVTRLLELVESVALSPPILRRAAQPLPVRLGTLDAIHLTSALAWRDYSGEELVMATHDGALGRAARAMGLRVLGC
jgi:hypothetical protein